MLSLLLCFPTLLTATPTFYRLINACRNGRVCRSLTFRVSSKPQQLSNKIKDGHKIVFQSLSNRWKSSTTKPGFGWCKPRLTSRKATEVITSTKTHIWSWQTHRWWTNWLKDTANRWKNHKTAWLKGWNWNTWTRACMNSSKPSPNKRIQKG